MRTKFLAVVAGFCFATFAFAQSGGGMHEPSGPTLGIGPDSPNSPKTMMGHK